MLIENMADSKNVEIRVAEGVKDFRWSCGPRFRMCLRFPLFRLAGENSPCASETGNRNGAKLCV